MAQVEGLTQLNICYPWETFDSPLGTIIKMAIKCIIASMASYVKIL
jgi:hypothetical protein